MTLALDRPAGEAVTSTDDLVRQHLPLVGHLVREMINRLPAQVHRDDLVSAGMYALAVSAANFDASKGVPFAAYASLRIRGALTDELRGMDWASRGVRGKARELETARATLTQRLGRTPSSTEVAHAMGLSVRELSAISADVVRANVTSLQGLPLENADEILPADAAGPESLLMQREQLGYLHDAISELPVRLRTVVEQYFFQQRRMADIAVDLGVTESRVSQLRSEALAMLRAGMSAADGHSGETQKSSIGRRQAALQTYAHAVAKRSTVSSRLAATTMLAEYCG